MEFFILNNAQGHDFFLTVRVTDNDIFFVQVITRYMDYYLYKEHVIILWTTVRFREIETGFFQSAGPVSNFRKGELG